MFKQVFAHHPNCDLYDHHVYRLGSLRLCVGCTGFYTSFVVSLLLDIIMNFNLPINLRFILGYLFFIPAIIQLVIKHKSRSSRFIMRFSLGSSAYLLISAAFIVEGIYWKILNFAIFITVAFIYSRKQGLKQLIECVDCKYAEEYHSCKIKFEDIMKIDGLELIFDLLSDDIMNVLEINITD